MRHRSILASSCLVLLSVAACGDDGGSGPTDANNNGGDAAVDAYEPPVANCNPLDLGSAPEVPIVSNQPITPNPQGGTVVAGTYELTSVKLYALGGAIAVTGTAQARVEIVVGNATTGAARIAVAIDAMAAGQAIQDEITGAGLYTLSSTALTVADGCGGSEPLPVLSYTATGSALTMWTEYMVTQPIPTTIPIELGLAAQ